MFSHDELEHIDVPAPPPLNPQILKSAPFTQPHTILGHPQCPPHAVPNPQTAQPYPPPDEHKQK